MEADIPSRRPSPAAVDEALRVLLMADALLPDEGAWDRSSERIEGPVDGRYTLFGSLATACEMVTGSYSHRHPALQAVRHAVEAQAPERQWKHRLAEFNAEASFSEIKAVIGSAIAMVRSRYGAS